MINNSNITILVVDDEFEIRSLIADFLEDSEEYNVLTAEDGYEALSILEKNSDNIDLILSDINMPKLKGFDLLNKVRLKWPKIKRVLITAYNVEDYVELALKYDVGNIFVKTTPFNFEELSTMLTNLLSEDIFGAHKYFEKNYSHESMLIKEGKSLDKRVAEITSKLPIPEHVNPNKINLVLVELLTNAIFYGIRNEDPAKKSSWNYDFILSDDEAIKIDYFWNEEKYAIAICDNGGHLKKKDVLFWLNRQTSKDISGLPLGITDTHGRGFFIARRYIDRLVVNINTNKKTEIIIINYINQVYEGFKPLFINEI